MLVRKISTDARTGEVTETMVESPDTLTVAQGDVLHNQRMQMATNQQTILQQAAAALDSNATFLALTAPTAAQNAGQVRALTRQVNGLIRLTLRKLDSTT